MYIIEARNVNEAWPKAKQFLLANHVARPSRNGPVLEAPAPVCTIYERPCERVLFDPVRDCNPWFHLLEAIWMIAGRNDVAWISQFNANMKTYSDDGETFHGAYGYRWRNWFEMYGGGTEDDTDQLPKIIRMLKANPDERRAVLAMWDPVHDLEKPKAKDLPCNTQIYLKIRQGRLEVTICCRSNDLVWGLMGANTCHMSILLEYMAAMIGVPVGRMFTVSDSFHAYSENEVWKRCIDASPAFAAGKAKVNPQSSLENATGGLTAINTGDITDPYSAGLVEFYPLVAEPACFDSELYRWMSSTESKPLDEERYTNPFFPHVAQPLYNAWCCYKDKNIPAALESVELCWASDWRKACREWLERRLNKKKVTA